MSNQDMAKEILGLVGGEENVNQLTHCATRLRFVLKDDTKADLKKLSAVEGVLTAQNKGGQLQVVIGAKVDQIYDEVLKISSITAGGALDGQEEAQNLLKKQNPLNQVLETIAGVFTPILPALIGCGMIQCLSKIAVLMGGSGRQRLYCHSQHDRSLRLLFYALFPGSQRCQKIQDQRGHGHMSGSMLHASCHHERRSRN